jgi:uncharacterized protein YgbK (DUF1537 family)
MHIIADDLTGAADASVAFAGTAPVRLLLDLPLRRQAAPVGHVAIDVDCRDVAAETAATRMAAALDRLPAGAELFVKIDSLLRGRIADMLHELRQWACGRPLVLAPALPAMGRSTAGGRLQIAGEVHWQTPSLFEMVDGLEPAWVCDAADDADLDAIVATMSQTVENAIWVGTAGLAKAIARARCGAWRCSGVRRRRRPPRHVFWRENSTPNTSLCQRPKPLCRARIRTRDCGWRAPTVIWSSPSNSRMTIRLHWILRWHGAWPDWSRRMPPTLGSWF